MSPCCANSQSRVSYSSLTATVPKPNTVPSEWVAVAASRPRAVASLAAGSISRATINASASNRVRGAPGGINAALLTRGSSPRRRAIPSAAAIWPCGSEHNLKAVAGRLQRLVAQHRAQCGYLLGLPSRQVGQSAVLVLAGLAIGLAQQNGRGRAAIWNNGDVHEAI